MSALGFASPWLLLALAGLPLVWWLLRSVPPAPAERRFGGILFLRRIQDEEQTPDRTPWWLLLLRLLAAASIVVGLAGPMLNAPEAREGSGAMLFVMDDGWTGAPGWRAAQDVVANEAARPGATEREAYLLLTATDEPVLEGPMTLSDAAERVAGESPKPRLAALDQAARTLRASPLIGMETVWLAGGATEGGRARSRFLAALDGKGDVTLVRPAGAEVLAISGLDASGAALTATLARVGSGVAARGDRLVVLARDGRVLTTVPFSFASGERETTVPIDLPIGLRNQAALLRVESERSAGATWLVDASARRARAGLVTAGEAGSLLTSATYLTQALEPAALLTRGGAEELAEAGMDVIVLDDVGTLRPQAVERLTEWIASGGLLVRFAGPDTANAADTTNDTFPAPLRAGGRSFGGALSWETPQAIGRFEREGPFAGLAAPEGTVIRRQVLTRAGYEAEVWASLEDGTPLVSARRVGEGLVVLFHVTASPTWSDLPLSGAFPSMLARIVNLANASGDGPAPDAPLSALQLMNGYGELSEPTSDAARATPEAIEAGRVSPGLYGLPVAPVAVNAWSGMPELVPAARGLPPGFAVIGASTERVRRLGPPLLAIGLGLLALDALVMAFLSRPARRGGAALAVLLLGAFPLEVDAQPRPPLDQKAVSAATETRFAYVETGDPSTDRISRAGLYGLTREAIRRSALEPAEPVGIDVERDDLSVYPLLYWPLTASARIPSDAALSRLEAYMNGGGLLVIDTQDGERAAAGARTERQARLRDVLRRMDTPPLEPLPNDHILRVSFYRLDDLHGRNSGGPVWVEARGALRETTDGVPSLVVAGRDWASAWAVDVGGVPLRPAGRGGEGRREAAYRSGINIAMVALTGNYKGDQVHVGELLERLGEEAGAAE